MAVRICRQEFKKGEGKMKAFANKSTDELNKEYIGLCLGAMIYGINTAIERRKIADEIDRREGKEPFDWDNVI